MDTVRDLVKPLYTGYTELNQHLSLSRTLWYGLAGLGAYGLYSFGVKPFLSPLRKIPGPGYNPLFGNVREAMVGEAMESSVKWVKKYGGIVRFYHLFGRERVLIADPKALKHIVLTNCEKYARVQTASFLGGGIFFVTGQEHKHQRRLLNPFFNHSSVNSYLEVFERHVLELIDWWKEKYGGLEDGTEVDVQDDLMRMTLDIIGEAVFGYQFNCLREPDSPVARAFHNMTAQLGIGFTRLIPFYSLLPTPANRRQKENLRLVNDTVYSIIREKRQLLETQEDHSGVSKDLLGKMMLAKDEETGLTFTDKELRDQVLSLLVAGHETTAASLSWFLLLLAQNQDIQSKVRSEVVTHLPTPDSPLTWQHIDSMEYLNCVVKEGQRLYPAAPSFYRRALKDDIVNGYLIPAGTVIAYHVGALMRNPDLWPDPEKFDPDRFSVDKEIDLYHYLPFNTGPHKCLGHQFARMEMKTSLAFLLREFKFDIIPDAKFVRKLRVTLKAFPPIRLAVTRF